MKNLLFKLFLICALIGLPSISVQGKGAVKTKEKKEVFTFSNIKDGATLKLKNSFGDINIIYWDKDQIRLDRKLSVSAPTIQGVEEILNKRVVKQSSSGNVYSLVLEMLGGGGSFSCNNLDDNWTVYIPKGKLSFDVTSKYGNINFPEDVKAQLINVSLRHGDLRMKSVHTEDRCDVNVEFGNICISEANRLILIAKYTDVELGHIDRLTFRAAHGNFDIKRLRRGDGTLSFTEFNLSSMEQELNVSKCQYGGVNIHVTNAKGFEELQLYAEHTPVKLFLPKQLNASYSLQARHGSVKLIPGMHSTVSLEGGYKDHFICTEEGYIGNDPHATPRIRLRTEFADVKVKQQ